MATPSAAVYLPVAANNPPQATTTPDGWQPSAGGWAGANEQGRPLTFTVAATQNQVLSLRLNVEHEGSCGGSIEVAHDFTPFPITGKTFSAKAGDSQVQGTFTSPTAATGVYTSVVQIFTPVRCTATHAGTWTASFGGSQSTPTPTTTSQATSEPTGTATATATSSGTPTQTPSATAAPPLDGTWFGVTDQGHPVTMTVSALGTTIPSFTLEVHFNDVCGAIVDITQTFFDGAVVGDEFQLVSGDDEVRGQFTSPTAAQGTFKSTARLFFPISCKVTYAGTWTATRPGAAAQPPSPQLRP